jgi:collagen type VII alpha
MAVDFPNSPTLGQTYTYGSRSWQWNGVAWQAISTTVGYSGSMGYTGSVGPAGESSYTTSNTAPISPLVGDRWFNTNFGVELVYTFDGNSYQWVEIAASGFMGPIGYTGSAGSGFVGSAGYAGSLGYTGSQAYTGSQGFTGSGYTGSQGYIGSFGYTGSQAYTGSQGYWGSFGYTGSVGFVGSVGYVGSQGNKAGYPYTFTTTIGGGATATGEFRYDSATVSSVANIYLNASSSAGVNLSTFISTWSNSSNGIKGTILINDVLNSSSFTNIFYVNGTVTLSSGTYQVPVAYVSGSSTPTNNENIIVNFDRAGDFGYTGSVGFVGSQGYWGSFGYTGSVGFVGSVGYAGSIGYTGSVGFVGSGYTGSVGFVGSVGLNTSIIALSDEFSNISTGYLGSRASFWAPYNMALSQVPRLTLTTAGTSTTTVDMLVNGSSILSTKLTLTSGYSGSAATPAVTTTTSITNGSFIQFIMTSAGSGAAGLKVTLYY